MARLRVPEPVQPTAELPADLHRDNVSTAHFVSPMESPPAYWGDDEYWWRRIRAWRRWRDAVAEWGASVGLDRADLMRLGYWPNSPLAMADEGSGR